MTTTRRHVRAALAFATLACVGGATALVLHAFDEHLVFFHTPSQVAGGALPATRAGAGAPLVRIGGLVEVGSIRRDGAEVRFAITDTAAQVPVVYRGLLPDLFQPGRGVVAQGRLRADGVLVAHQVLARHDEHYLAPDAAAAIDAAGRAHPGEAPR